MRLTSLTFLVVLCVCAAATAGGTALVWDRSTRWPMAAAWPARVMCLALVMLSGAVLVMDETNRVYQFYGSFGELVGHPPPPVPAEGAAAALPPDVLARGRAAAATGHGIVISRVLAGPDSGLRRPAFVYLPAAYFDPARAAARFSVLELFHGYPGIAKNWLTQMHLAQTLDTEINAGRIPPMIAVIPTDTDGVRDEECLNDAEGIRDETYLALDIPHDIARDYRTAPGGRGWATMGYSTGGYCAVNLALRHPTQYGAAVALSGYFTAPGGHTGQALFGRSRAAVLANSPTWWVRHHPLGQVALYLLASGADREAITDLEQFRRTLPTTAPATVLILPTGGHNYKVWSAVEPAAIDWLGSHLTAPTSPPLIPPGARLETPGTPPRPHLRPVTPDKIRLTAGQGLAIAPTPDHLAAHPPAAPTYPGIHRLPTATATPKPGSTPQHI